MQLFTNAAATSGVLGRNDHKYLPRNPGGSEFSGKSIDFIKKQSEPVVQSSHLTLGLPQIMQALQHQQKLVAGRGKRSAREAKLYHQPDPGKQGYHRQNISCLKCYHSQILGPPVN